MLCASLPETTSAQAILHHSTFCEELIAQLVSLYSKLPKEMDPVRIDSVDAKWGCVFQFARVFILESKSAALFSKLKSCCLQKKKKASLKFNSGVHS